jgi:hypothetical protein
MNIKRTVFDHIKNIKGWKTNRKIVVISVDDYGNVRLNSKVAREKLDASGLKVFSNFDAFDALETKEDLLALYEVLTSVKDANGKAAIFTPFALPCNINFENMAEMNHECYIYETLPETYQKLSAIQPKAYDGTWDIWKEGIKSGLMVPQFHGREHLNMKIFNEKLKNKDKELLENFKNRSYTSISNTAYPTISYTAAFEFDKLEENETFESIIEDGLMQFEKVYGYRSIHFNPPGGREHTLIHKYLKKNGIKYIDTPYFKLEHQGKGKYKKVLNWTGKINENGMIYQVRNVVFEPTFNSTDWVGLALNQIETAFFWKKPAIISSHRVNFCGHIDPNNREKGLAVLKELLSKIVKKWPDVEFMSADELAETLKNNNL